MKVKNSTPHATENDKLILLNGICRIIDGIGSSRINVKNFPVHYGLGETTTGISVKSL
jgi:ribosomal protein L36